VAPAGCSVMSFLLQEDAGGIVSERQGRGHQQHCGSTNYQNASSHKNLLLARGRTSRANKGCAGSGHPKLKKAPPSVLDSGVNSGAAQLGGTGVPSSEFTRLAVARHGIERWDRVVSIRFARRLFMGNAADRKRAGDIRN
jgi:hypothetical protein